MSIEKKLRQDASRLSEIQPPPDLRARLQAGLEAAAPPGKLADQALRPVHRWFVPAVALLAAAMLLVFVIGLPGQYTDFGERLHTLGSPANQKDNWVEAVDSQDPGVTSTDYKNPTVREGANPSLPWARIGIFSGLAVITGILCLTELKGRPRLLVPALTALLLFVAAGLFSMVGI